MEKSVSASPHTAKVGFAYHLLALLVWGLDTGTCCLAASEKLFRRPRHLRGPHDILFPARPVRMMPARVSLPLLITLVPYSPAISLTRAALRMAFSRPPCSRRGARNIASATDVLRGFLISLCDVITISSNSPAS